MRSQSHFTYSKREQRLVALTDSRASWSGAYSAGLINGLSIPKESWTIISNPAGAKIYTDEGEKGITITTISVARAGNMFVVLQKDGYLDCSHKDAACKLETTPGGKVLTCNLKKRR
jgi:hypothetical protein